MAGFFKVPNEIFDHPFFDSPSFTRREAFFWLLKEAKECNRKVRVGKLLIELQPRQLACSVRYMAEKWGWSKSAVDRFLKTLKTGTLIETDSGTGILIITICNTNNISDSFEYTGTATGTATGTVAGQQRDSSGTNIEKKGKERKRSSTIPIVPLRDDLKTAEPIFDNDFEEVWDSYFAVHTNKGSKAKAKEVYIKVRQSGVVPWDILDGVRRCREYLTTTGNYSKHVSTWLRARGWEDDYTINHMEKSRKQSSGTNALLASVARVAARRGLLPVD